MSVAPNEPLPPVKRGSSPPPTDLSAATQDPVHNMSLLKNGFRTEEQLSVGKPQNPWQSAAGRALSHHRWQCY